MNTMSLQIRLILQPNSRQTANFAIRQLHGFHQPTITIANIFQFIVEIIVANGRIVLHVIPTRPILRFFTVSPVMSTINQIWIQNTREEPDMFITVLIVWLVILLAGINHNSNFLSQSYSIHHTIPVRFRFLHSDP
jgi:hypothetical protein